MNLKRIVNITTILKRSSCVNSINESHIDSVRVFNKVKNAIETENMNLFNAVFPSYITALSEYGNANIQCLDIIDLLEKVKDNNLANKIVTEYKRIIPYLSKSNLANIINYSESCNISDDIKKEIKACAEEYIVIDRIIENNNRLNSKFNVEKTCKKFLSKPNLLIEYCANIVDHYNIKSYQKFSVALEEAIYLLEINKRPINRSSLLQGFTEYYLIKYPDFTMKEADRVVTESILFEDNELEVLHTAISNVTEEKMDVNNALVKISNSSINKDTLDIFITDINKCLPVDVIANMDKIINLFKNIVVNNLVIYDVVISDIGTIINNIVLNSYNGKLYDKESIETLINTITNIKNEIESNDDMSNTNITNFVKELDYQINNLIDCRDTLYTKYNLSAMMGVDAVDESVLSLLGNTLYNGKKMINNSKKSLSKIFKFNNLITATMNLDKYLANKEKKLSTKIQKGINKVVKKTKNILFGESTKEYEFMKYLGEDNKICVPVAQYSYDVSIEREFVESIDNICKEYNASNEFDSIKVYYENVSNILTIYLKDNNEVDETIIKEYTERDLTSELDIYVDEFNTLYEAMNTLEGKYIYTVNELICNIDESFTIEHLKLALECMRYLNVSSDDIDLLKERFILSLYNGHDDYKIDKIVREAEEYFDSFTTESVNDSLQIEAYSLLLGVLEDADCLPKEEGVMLEALADDWDDEDEEDDEEDDKKEQEKKEEKKVEPKKEDPKEKKSIADKLARGLNRIRLGLEGIKYKAKEMGAKEEEMSRNIDSSSRALAKAVKNCFVTDRREAIIKGSVIPSLSRCIKNGILLAGMGLATQTVAVPAIALVAGLAVSKRLNKKERLLLLDEIETELEVVEKEIQAADSDNNMKKYRALLQYRKELQRQYQRIRYNIRIGKDLLPSDTGVPKPN